MSYTAIASQTLTSSAASVTFSSIPTDGTYRDLVLVINATVSGTNTTPTFTVNGNATGYNQVWAAGNGSTTGSSSTSADAKFYLSYYNNDTTRQQHTIHFMDYSVTDKHKSVLIRSDQASTGTTMSAGRWANTAAITSITLLPQSSGSLTWSTGSTFSLYGIAA